MILLFRPFRGWFSCFGKLARNRILAKVCAKNWGGLCILEHCVRVSILLIRLHMVKNMFDSLHQDWRSKNVKVSNGQKINVITAPKKPKMHLFGKKRLNGNPNWIQTCFFNTNQHNFLLNVDKDHHYLLHLKF